MWIFVQWEEHAAIKSAAEPVALIEGLSPVQAKSHHTHSLERGSVIGRPKPLTLQMDQLRLPTLPKRARGPGGMSLTGLTWAWPLQLDTLIPRSLRLRHIDMV